MARTTAPTNGAKVSAAATLLSNEGSLTELIAQTYPRLCESIVTLTEVGMHVFLEGDGISHSVTINGPPLGGKSINRGLTRRVLHELGISTAIYADICMSVQDEPSYTVTLRSRSVEWTPRRKGAIPKTRLEWKWSRLR